MNQQISATATELAESLAKYNVLLPRGITARMTKAGIVYSVRSSRSINGFQHKVTLGTFFSLPEAQTALANFKAGATKKSAETTVDQMKEQLAVLQAGIRAAEEKQVTAIVEMQKDLKTSALRGIPKEVIEFLDWNENQNPLVMESSFQIFIDKNGDPIEVRKKELEAWWSTYMGRLGNRTSLNSPEPESNVTLDPNPKTNESSQAARPATGPTKQQILQDLLDQREDLESQINEELAEAYDEQDHEKIESLGGRVKELTELINRILEDDAAAGASDKDQAQDDEDPFSI